MDKDPSELHSKRLHLYLARQTSHIEDLPSLQELCLSQLSTIKDLSMWRQLISDKIDNYHIEASAPNAQLAGDFSYLAYLRHKQYVFMHFYGVALSPNSNPWVYHSQNLLNLMSTLKEIQSLLIPLIKKKHGPKNVTIKTEGFYLLQQLQQLLYEVFFAAVPFGLQEQNQHLFPQAIQPVQQLGYASFLQRDRKVQQPFIFKKESYLIHSVIELGYQVETKTQQLSKQSKKQMPLQDIMEQIAAAEKLSKDKLRLFYFQLVQFCGPLRSDPVKPRIEAIAHFVKNHPLSKMQEGSLREFQSLSVQLEEIDFNQWSLVYLHAVKAIWVLLEHSQVKKQQVAQLSAGFCGLCDKWLLLMSNPDLQFLQAFRLGWAARHALQKDCLATHQNRIYAVLKKYLDKMSNSILQDHLDVMQQIVTFDQELTFQILSSQIILATLLSKQHSLHALLTAFGPHISKGMQLTRLSKINNQLIFIQQMIKWRASPSLGEKASESQVKQSKILSYIDSLLELQADHEEFSLIKPYLREFRFIMALSEGLKQQLNPHNSSRSQQDIYRQLQAAAQYFSLQRPECPLYQLKAQVLLFVCLFKLGYHSPTYKHQGKIVNLKNHIINLYQQLYVNTKSSSILLSRISFDLSNRTSSADYQVFDPTSLPSRQSKVNSSAIVIDDYICLGASQTLYEKVKRFIRNRSVDLAETELNCKSYLANLMNLLQNQLFLQQQQHSKEEQNVTGNHYIQHLRAQLGFSFQDEEMNKLITLEGLFYCGHYEKAWRELVLYNKDHPELVQQTLQELEHNLGPKYDLFRLLRVYNTFSRMPHLFVTSKNSPEQVQQLQQAINASTRFPVSRQPVEVLCQLYSEQKRREELQIFFDRMRGVVPLAKSEVEWIEYESCLSSLNLVTLRQSKANKELICVRIGQAHHDKFEVIRQQLEQYYLLNIPGIARLTEVKLVPHKDERLLQIFLESNYFCVVKPQVNKSVLKVDDHLQNHHQKLIRNFISTLIQGYHIFKSDVVNLTEIKSSQINFNGKEITFNINPYFMVLQSILDPPKHRNNSQQFKCSYSIKISLAEFIQKSVEPLKPHCSAHFISNINYLLLSLRKISYKQIKWSTLLQVPLFMSLRQKQMFIIYFDNKMSAMCDDHFNKERQLRKDHKPKQLLNCRVASMKDPVFRNHRYNFSLNGIIERRMIDLRICGKDTEKLDWLSDHKEVKISYQLPRLPNQEVKQYVYSLNFMLKCLRGAIAHKHDHSYEAIASFNKEYPQLIDFLYVHKHLLEITYQQMLQRKTAWLLAYFTGGKELVKNLKVFITKAHNKELKAVQKINEYCQIYTQQVLPELRKVKIKCQRCNDFLKVVSNQNHLIDLFKSLAGKVESNGQLLEAEHCYYECWLARSFRNHRQIRAFGERPKQGEVKTFLTLNWWFYLQSVFPCLLQMLNQIRYHIIA